MVLVERLLTGLPACEIILALLWAQAAESDDSTEEDLKVEKIQKSKSPHFSTPSTFRPFRLFDLLQRTTDN